MKIGYQGVEGSYSTLACQKFAKEKTYSTKGYMTFKLLVEALLDNEVDYSTAIAPTWASASKINTPGMTGYSGKCPSKNGSLAETFFSPTTRFPSSISVTLSTNKNG